MFASPHLKSSKMPAWALALLVAWWMPQGPLSAQPVPGVPTMAKPIAPNSPNSPNPSGAPNSANVPSASNPPTASGGTVAARPVQAAAAGSAAPRTIGWEALVPADWDPMKDLKGLNLSILSDADPRAMAALAQLRQAWDNAPINPAVVGQTVRLPGYLVPLEETKDGLKEFLLVPYFGACIHSPPPPANQIVHVLPRTPAKGLRSMDTVWVTGVLTGTRTDSYMGMSGYRIEATLVTPYAERPAR
jgi:hypothetical protein